MIECAMTESASTHEVTRILEAISAGDPEAEQRLFPMVYKELRRMARIQMAREKPGQTLQPTALVHEVYLRLFGNENIRWENRAHFFGVAAEAMRRILIERARKKASLKRGGDKLRVTFAEAIAGKEPRAEEILALDQALSRLESRDPLMAQVVKLRYFAGLTVKETASAVGTSPRTVNNLWAVARAWLHREMARSKD